MTVQSMVRNTALRPFRATASAFLMLLALPGGAPLSAQTPAAAPVRLEILSKPQLFAGEMLLLQIAWQSGTTSPSGHLELVCNGQLVRKIRFSTEVIPSPGAQNIDGVPYTSGAWSVQAPGEVAPAICHVRAQVGEWLSPPTQNFAIEPWGVPVKGLQLGLTAEPMGSPRGGPISVYATIRNVGSEPLCIPFHPTEDTYARTHWRWVSRDAPVATRSDLGVSRPLVDPRPMRPAESKNQLFIMLKPGETQTARYDLHNLQLERTGVSRIGDTPGTIYVGATLFMYDASTPCDQPWRGEVVSNVTRVVIKP